jgi:tetratricopeptide (TPR) repeat protein
VDAFGEDLRRYLQGESIVAHPPSTLYQLRKVVRRHRLPVALASIVFVLVSAFAITATYQAMRIRAERDDSRRETAKAEAVSEFLRGMFASPSPEQRGHEVRVVDVLQAAGDKIDAGFEDQPEVRVVLHSTLGETYFGLGLYKEADERYEAALRAGTETLGERNELTLDAMSSLGVIRSMRNELADAENLLRGAYGGFIETLGEEASPTLIAANNLAGLLRRIDRLDEAEEMYRRTYEIRLRTLGENNLDTLASMNNLSMMLLFRGKPQEAEPLQLKTLRGCRRMFGESHPKTLLTLNNYARLLHRLGKLTEAASYFRELVALRRESLPAGHPDTMLTIDNLAMVLKDVGQFDEAARLFQELVDAYLGEDPPEHPAHWNARGKDLFLHHVVFELAAIHVRKKDADTVVRLFDRTLARASDFVGEDHWRLGRVRHRRLRVRPRRGPR